MTKTQKTLKTLRDLLDQHTREFMTDTYISRKAQVRGKDSVWKALERGECEGIAKAIYALGFEDVTSAQDEFAQSRRRVREAMDSERTQV